MKCQGVVKVCARAYNMYCRSVLLCSSTYHLSIHMRHTQQLKTLAKLFSFPSLYRVPWFRCSSELLTYKFIFSMFIIFWYKFIFFVYYLKITCNILKLNGICMSGQSCNINHDTRYNLQQWAVKIVCRVNR